MSGPPQSGRWLHDFALGNRYPWFEKGLRKPTPTLPYARGSVSARNCQRFIGEIERYVKIDCSVSIETLPILK